MYCLAFAREENETGSYSSPEFIWETRLGKDRIPDRSTGPYPQHNEEQLMLCSLFISLEGSLQVKPNLY